MSDKRYEVSIVIKDAKYIDRLVIALARQGYAPYISEENKCVCFEITSDELTEMETIRR